MRKGDDMADTAAQYANEIHRELRYLATWGPGTQLDLGDCGPIEKPWLFRRQASLSDFGIDFKPDDHGEAIDLHYRSAGGVEFSLKARGETAGLPNVPAGKAALAISFKKENAIVLETKGAVEVAIENLYEVQTKVLQGIRDKTFPRDHAVISSVVTAAGTAVLISKSSKSQLTVSAEADLSGLTDLASADAGLSIAHEREMSTTILGAPGLTPLFRAFRAKRNWPWEDEFKIGPLVEGDLELPDVGTSESPFDWVDPAHI
jgi:hypothetical protein